MEKYFRKSLVDQVSIKLDKEGLDGLELKEEMVLISDQLSQLHQDMIDSNESLGQKIDESKEHLGQKIDKSSEHLGQKIDESKEHLGQKIDDLSTKIDESKEHLGQKIDGLSTKIDESKVFLGQKIDGLGDKIDESSQQSAKNSELLRQDIGALHQELVNFRQSVGFWTKLLVGGVWAVAASFIAGVILILITRLF
jgi:DNA anti-recombination protein RmuC